MNRINQLFNSNKKDLLSIYFCAGDPTLDGTADVIRTLEKYGVSMIEVGIPFSDPMADGIVIQNAATQALRNGMSLKVLFEHLVSRVTNMTTKYFEGRVPEAPAGSETFSTLTNLVKIQPMPHLKQLLPDLFLLL